MQILSPDIMNLLLGVAPVPSGANGAPNGETVSPALLFGDLMNAALGSVPVTATAEAADPLQSVGSRPLGEEKPRGIEFGAFLPKHGTAMPTYGAYGDRPAAPPTVLAVNPQPAWDFETPEVIRIDTGLAPVDTNAPTMAPTAAPLPFASIPVAVPLVQGTALPLEMLPAGEYVITNSHISNGQVTLDLAPKDAKDAAGATIRITLPMADLAEAAGAKTLAPGSAMRTQLDGIPSQARLESWFAKVNLKELVITPTNPNNAATLVTDSAEAAPYKFEILAENAGRAVVIETTPTGSDIRIRSLHNRTTRPESIESTGLANKPAAGAPRVAAATPENSGGRLANENNLLFERDRRFLSLANAKGKLTGDTLDTASVLAESMRSRSDAAMARDRVETMPARFSLPPDFKQALKPNGHSVQLRIDPEHLGPARLNLILRDDHLSARVVVDSVQAKQAVEGSLDRLVQTLARADIKVDSIEVAVGQQGTREQWFAQHSPHWSRPNRTSRFRGIENESAAIPAAIAMSGSPSYVGSGGVNVLA